MLAEGDERPVLLSISKKCPLLSSQPLHLVKFAPAAAPAQGSDAPLKIGIFLSGGQAAGVTCSCAHRTAGVAALDWGSAKLPLMRGPDSSSFFPRLPPGPPAGGHNVIAGVFDNLERCRPGSTLYGFINGPKGLLENNVVVLTKDVIVSVRSVRSGQSTLRAAGRGGAGRGQGRAQRV